MNRIAAACMLLLVSVQPVIAHTGHGNASNTAATTASEPLVQDPWLAGSTIIGAVILVTSLYFIYRMIRTFRREQA